MIGYGGFFATSEEKQAVQEWEATQSDPVGGRR